jgi:hypothetical protein
MGAAAAVLETGRSSSSPLPARPPAAGKMKAAAAGPAGLRVRHEGGNESLGFPGCSGLIYTTDSGGLFFSPRSGDRRWRCTGDRADWNQSRRGAALGRLAGPAIGCWARSPRGRT